MSDESFRRGYTVRLEDAAIEELDEIFGDIGRDAPRAAQNWMNGFWRLVELLSEFNVNFAPARENDDSDFELRQVIHYSHRIVYTIDDEQRQVRILHIWHGARRNIPRGLL